MTVAGCVVVLAIFSCSCMGGEAEPPRTPPKAASDSVESKWGIALSSIRVSAGGYMIDFRYKVLDPEKAAPLARRETKAYLLDPKTGAKFLVPTSPKVGSLRQTSQKLVEGKIYFVFFANPGKYIKPGDKVTVVIGEYRAENLIVE